MKRLINWVEIPVSDMKRAKKFYEEILRISFHDMEIDGTLYALFPSEDKYNCGALAKSANHRPSTDGPIVYLDGGEDMDKILEQVDKRGGQILMPETFTGEDAGYIGMFIDSEGNRIGLQHA